MFDDFTSSFWANTIDGMTVGSIYALVALGYTMVYGVLRLINFAHSEIFMIGTFGALATMQITGINGPFTGFALVAVLLLCLAGSMLASGGAAVALERIAYRPLRKRGASRLAALISAIGASLFLQELFATVIIPKWFAHGRGRDTLGLAQAGGEPRRLMDKEVLFSIGSGDVRNDKVLIIVAALAMMIILQLFVTRSKLGRGIRATAQDPETAVLLGVNIDRIVVVTFLIGGLMAGAAAFFFLLFYEVTSYFIGFILGIKAFTAAVLGGIGNLKGALVGGFTLGLVENYGASIFGSEWKDVIAFTILVIVLMFRPTGILGESLQRARA
ncbi:branched-chain amino acid ABC transporter permease [Actinocorallia longicatena]|uniref:Branched-chain amino acid ABC transporter permease n=1 Tax=Actinocorallia longicatena TaxID=111803 RepID=A0ABP6QAC8_9ACTN